MTSYKYDRDKPFDPDYRAWEDIQGTIYEQYSDRFVGAHDFDEVGMMKAQIDRELNDRSVVRAGGGWGVLASISAALFSPTTLIPGGAIIKGAKGVSIARTSLSVAGSAALAALLDEIILQQTQQIRPAEESAFAIGGSVILGGMLGAFAGKLGAAEFKAMSKQVEDTMQAVHDLDKIGCRALFDKARR